jgi:hypothetical protein
LLEEDWLRTSLLSYLPLIYLPTLHTFFWYLCEQVMIIQGTQFHLLEEGWLPTSLLSYLLIAYLSTFHTFLPPYFLTYQPTHLSLIMMWIDHNQRWYISSKEPNKTCWKRVGSLPTSLLSYLLTYLPSIIATKIFIVYLECTLQE